MILSYFKIAFRNLWSNKLFSAINIGGLAIGIASAAVLLANVSYQYSFDRFHANKNNLYRVNLQVLENNKEIINSAENYSGIGPELLNYFPEIQREARLYNMGYKNNCVFTFEEKHIREKKFLYAEASFFSMFSFPFIQGNPLQSLVEPYTAVISESFAKKLFSGQSPMGKMIRMDDDDRNLEICRVTGVFKDVPANSHLKFNVLISYPTLFHRKDGKERYASNLDRKDFYTYVQLRPGTNPKILQSRLTSFLYTHMPGEKTGHMKSRVSLQPLSDIHLNTGLMDEPEVTVNGKTMLFLIIIAFFIVTVAWVNYINLATAGSLNRAREIGVRKVLGSQRKQLVVQFFSESICINGLGVLLAFLMICLAKPILNQFFPGDLQFKDFLNNGYGLVFAGSILAGTFLSGLYPAFILSSFKPVNVLKGKVKASKNGIILRKSLVVFQFSLSIFLIIGTLVVFHQMRYLTHQNLGMNVSQIIVLERPGKWDSARASHNLYVQRFKTELKNSPAIEAVAMSDELPGKEIRYPGIYSLKNEKNVNAVPIITISIDEDYFHALGINIIAGRNFSKEFKTDHNSLVISQSAAAILGFNKEENPIGKQIFSDGTAYSIIGEVNDIHHLSFIQGASPAIFQINDDAREFEYYLVKVKTKDARMAIDQVQTAWNNSFKDNPFNFIFLDEYFNRQYKSEEQFEMLFGVFSMIAILISCIGLFALVAYMVRQRMNEIGVRKVLGAGIGDLLFLLSRDFMILILLSNVIAWPLGWLLMNNWLNDFPYRIQIDWSVFIISGLLAFLIALGTISLQALKAASANPIKNIRAD